MRKNKIINRPFSDVITPISLRTLSDRQLLALKLQLFFNLVNVFYEFTYNFHSIS
jgi:hypothetical protein